MDFLKIILKRKGISKAISKCSWRKGTLRGMVYRRVRVKLTPFCKMLLHRKFIKFSKINLRQLRKIKIRIKFNNSRTWKIICKFIIKIYNCRGKLKMTMEIVN